MSKILRCSICNAYLGEIIKGKIKKETTLICKDCDPSSGTNSFHKENDVPDFMKDLFGNFNARRN